MRKVFILFFAVVVICVSSQSDAKALAREDSVSSPSIVVSQDRNSISGFVFGESRTPVSQIYVELLNDFYSTVSRVQTRGSGLFSFRNLPQGRYNVRVVTLGTDFEEQTQSVSLVPFSIVQGRGVVSEQIDFYLKVRKKGNGIRPAAPAVLFAQEVPGDAKTLYESGISDLADKNETAGLDKIKRSIEIFPDYFLALDRLGNEYVIRGYYQPAALLLARAVTVNSKSYSSTFGLGLAEFRLGQIDKAFDHFKASTEMNKDSANAHLWLGIAHHSKNDLSRALASMLRANELSNGTTAEVHWQLARVYKDQKRFAKSAEELELFLKYSPEAKNFDEIKVVIAKLRQKK